jgi:hypothetical protein
MPVGSIVVAAIVVAIFVGFAGVLAWGDAQTRRARLKAPIVTPKRRSF